MKNSEIHKNLSYTDLRDTLARAVSIDVEIYAIDFFPKNFARLKSKLRIAKTKADAVQEIIRRGWSIIDVSDEIDDYSSESYFDFIGTEDELTATLIGGINEDKTADMASK